MQAVEVNHINSVSSINSQQLKRCTEKSNEVYRAREDIRVLLNHIKLLEQEEEGARKEAKEKSLAIERL